MTSRYVPSVTHINRVREFVACLGAACRETCAIATLRVFMDSEFFQGAGACAKIRIGAHRVWEAACNSVRADASGVLFPITATTLSRGVMMQQPTTHPDWQNGDDDFALRCLRPPIAPLSLYAQTLP